MKPALMTFVAALLFSSAVQGQRQFGPGTGTPQFTPRYQFAPSHSAPARGSDGWSRQQFQPTLHDPPARPLTGSGPFNLGGGGRVVHGFTGSHFGNQPNVTARRFGTSGWHFGRDFDHDGHHHRQFIFLNSCWFWWDDGFGGWCYWPGLPPPSESYADDGDWQFAPDAAPDTAPADYDRGRMRAQDLRREVVTWDQFVAYFKANILNSSPVVFSEFRRGFVAGYGENAGAAFDKAVQQAAPTPPPLNG